MKIFVVIYKLLSALEECMDIKWKSFAERDAAINEALGGISLPLRYNVAVMLQEADMIEQFSREQKCEANHIDFCVTRLTLDGLEYLHTSPLMKTAAAIAISEDNNIIQ